MSIEKLITPLELFFLIVIALEAGVIFTMSYALKYWLARVAELKATNKRQRDEIDAAIAAVERARRLVDGKFQATSWPNAAKAAAQRPAEDTWADTIEEKE